MLTIPLLIIVFAAGGGAGWFLHGGYLEMFREDVICERCKTVITGYSGIPQRCPMCGSTYLSLSKAD